MIILSYAKRNDFASFGLSLCMRFLLILSVLFCSQIHSQSAFQRTYAWQKNQQGFCVQQTSDAGYILCGNIVLDSANTDLVLLRTNSQGDTLWSKHYGGPQGEHEGIVSQTSD